MDDMDMIMMKKEDLAEDYLEELIKEQDRDRERLWKKIEELQKYKENKHSCIINFDQEGE